jgi:hypothetical protein
MQYTLKALAAAALIASIGVANAASVTTAVGETNTFNGTPLTLEGGTGTLSFSASLLAALNVGQVAVTAVAPATVTGTPAGNNVAAAAPITSVTADDVSGQVLGVATAGGALQTAPVVGFISNGGTLAVTNLNVDLTSKAIYASITGDFTGAATGVPGTATGGAVTTIDNFHLWDYTTLTGASTISGEGTFNTTLSGLTITADGYKHFVSALRLLQFGTAALQSVTDYGTISSTITVTAAVPEPSTYAMAIAGLALVGVAARRARKA